MFPTVSRRTASTHRRIVLWAILALYLLCFMEFLAQWYFLVLAVVIEGDTRESIVSSILGTGPKWIGTLDDFLFYSSLIVSYGLLVGGCIIALSHYAH